MNGATTIRARLASEDTQRMLHALRRYVVGLSFVGIAFLIRYWLTPVLGEELPFVLFIAASLLAAWYGGAVTGITALLLGLFLADYFFITRNRSQTTITISSSLVIFRYMFTAGLGIALIEVQHRARRRTEKALDELKREVALRKQSEQALLEAQEQLRNHAAKLEHHVNERTVALRGTVASLQEVLYNIAHHLRAPLRAMSGFSDILLEQYASKLDPKGRDLAEHISRAAAKMDTLTQDLLEFGRLGHVEVVPIEIRLQAVIKAAMAKLAHAIEASRAEIIIREPLPTVCGDAAILEKVLVEILDNAIKFARSGIRPSIHIRPEARGKMVRLWIEDNGIGVEPRYHQRIFGVFETLHPEDARGTGIGLAIVKQAMNRLGGDAGVESEPSHGSRFWIELPAAAEKFLR